MEKERQVSITRRLTQDGLLLALLCVVGMLAIPFGDNVKVSLQLLAVYLVCFLSFGLADCLIITGSYLLLGLFLPIYAGFASGLTPTFGYVIGFVLAAPAIYLLNRIKVRPYFRLALACVVGLLIVYVAGTVFMMAYLSWDLSKTLLVSVWPYIPFDLLKIFIAVPLSDRLRHILGMEKRPFIPKDRKSE